MVAVAAAQPFAAGNYVHTRTRTWLACTFVFYVYVLRTHTRRTGIVWVCVCVPMVILHRVPVHKRSAAKINDSLCVCARAPGRACVRVSRVYGGVFTQSISDGSGRVGRVPRSLPAAVILGGVMIAVRARVRYLRYRNAGSPFARKHC